MLSYQAEKKEKMEVLDILSGEDLPATRFMISLKYFKGFLQQFTFLFTEMMKLSHRVKNALPTGEGPLCYA